jgi:hypothetical protein
MKCPLVTWELREDGFVKVVFAMTVAEVVNVS